MDFILRKAIIAVAALIAMWWFRKKLKKNLRNKKVLFTGPEASGKTTIIRWILGYDFEKNYTPTSEYKEYGLDSNDYGPNSKEFKDKDDKFDFLLTDMPGGDEFVYREEYKEMVKQRDVIVFTFDSYKFINEDNYREKVSKRIDILNDVDVSEKTVYAVASHYDEAQKLTSMFANEISGFIDEHLKSLGWNYEYDCYNLTEKNEVKFFMIRLLDLLKETEKRKKK